VIVTLNLRVPVNLEGELDALKNLYILEALRATDGNISKAAGLLGLTRVTLGNWLRAAEARTAKIVRDAIEAEPL
jgi:DNA-binding NtrC family response regulator